jgi:L-ascorbate metabolism protein UlaG (beta-lactamase superfamily)
MNVKGGVEIATEERFATNDKETQIQIEGPGEYEVGDFSIKGISAQRHLDADDAVDKKSTMYRIEVGDVRIALIGNIAPKLTEDQLESLGVVDILIIPVGGNGYTLDATSASALSRQIDPKTIIPIHYADSALKYEVSQDTLETFTKELGAPVETTAKLKVKGAAALPQTLTVIELTRS